MNNNFFKEIESKKKDFTTKELEVCDLLEDDPFSFAASTASEISKKYNVSQAAISRFCQKLGFKGFSEFRMSLLMATSNSDEKISNSPSDYANELSNVILKLGQGIDDSLLDQVAEKITISRNVYTSGYGASDIVANLLAFRLMLGGIKAHHIESSKETEFLHIMNHQDTVVLYSVKNSSHADFMESLKDLPEDRKPYVILICGTSKHPYTKDVDLVVPIPNLYLIDSMNQLTLPQSVQLLYTIILIQKIYDASKKEG